MSTNKEYHAYSQSVKRLGKAERKGSGVITTNKIDIALILGILTIISNLIFLIKSALDRN